jgi:hypothetical protein
MPMSLRLTGGPADDHVSLHELAALYPASARRALVEQGGLPFPEDLPMDVMDDVEFESRNSTTLRRGTLREFVSPGKCYVIEHRVTGRAKVFTPHISYIRRVYRGGVEVARYPWLTEEPVPLPAGVVYETPLLSRGPAWPDTETMKALPAPTDPSFTYRVDDVVAYLGKGGNVYKGAVSIVIPAYDTYETELRVVRPGGGRPAYPRLAKIRRVWRAGALIAVHRDLVEE